MNNNCLILDFDTNVDDKNIRILEISWMVYNLEKRIPIYFQSFIVKDNIDFFKSHDYDEFSSSDIESFGFSNEEIIDNLEYALENCDYLMGNHWFDWKLDILRKWSPNEVWFDEFIQKTIQLDTVYDLPIDVKFNDLMRLANIHGILIPLNARSFNKVLVMSQILGYYSIEELVKNSDSPVVTVLADVDFDNKHLAKNAGFEWWSNIWRKKMRKREVTNQSLDWDFKYRIED